MGEIFSDAQMGMHIEQVRKLRLKYSILKKSGIGIETEDIREIARQKMDSELKSEALMLLSEIKAHELFFSSFGVTRQPESQAVRKYYQSTASFLNCLFRLGRDMTHGFLGVELKGERPIAFAASGSAEAMLSHRPLLLVDMFEHAYFLDYGFDRERYLIAALSYLAVDLI